MMKQTKKPYTNNLITFAWEFHQGIPFYPIHILDLLISINIQSQGQENMKLPAFDATPFRDKFEFQKRWDTHTLWNAHIISMHTCHKGKENYQEVLKGDWLGSFSITNALQTHGEVFIPAWETLHYSSALAHIPRPGRHKHRKMRDHVTRLIFL